VCGPQHFGYPAIGECGTTLDRKPILVIAPSASRPPRLGNVSLGMPDGPDDTAGAAPMLLPGNGIALADARRRPGTAYTTNVAQACS
jgi:hypothetical protein